MRAWTAQGYFFLRCIVLRTRALTKGLPPTYKVISLPSCLSFLNSKREGRWPLLPSRVCRAKQMRQGSWRHCGAPSALHRIKVRVASLSPTESFLGRQGKLLGLWQHSTHWGQVQGLCCFLNIHSTQYPARGRTSKLQTLLSNSPRKTRDVRRWLWGERCTHRKSLSVATASGQLRGSSHTLLLCLPLPSYLLLCLSAPFPQTSSLSVAGNMASNSILFP